MFGAPLFLITAAVGALVPLFLHLLQKNRTVYQPFPTLRFLKLAQKRSSQKIRLSNILLMLIRTAILTLLGIAFASPILRTRGLGFLGRAARDVAIVLDVSYSMQYQVGRRTVFDNAVEAATDIINRLAPNDRYCLYLAKENPVALIAEPLGDKERGLSLLKEAKPASSTSRIAPALAAAYNALLQVPQRRERELHILTDNQAVPWNEFKEQAHPDSAAEQSNPNDEPSSSLLWNPASLDKKTPIFVSLLGVQAPANFAPSNLELSPAYMFASASARLAAQISASGEAPETTVALFIDGQEVARRRVQTEGQPTGAASFVIPPLSLGTHIARLETPDDNLSVDNAFHFLIRVRDRLPIMCVGNEEDTIFLRAALKAGAAGAESTWITPDRVLSEINLGSFSCIFLANALSLPGQTIAELERYAANGGVLVFFPGSHSSLEDYRAWDCLPGIPSEIKTYSGQDRNRLLTWDKPGHTLLSLLREGLAIPQATIERCLRLEKINPQSIILISAGQQQPFLLQRDYGRGSVLLFSVSSDRSWSNFPLSPYYLPLMMQIVEYSAGVGNEPPFTWCAESTTLDPLLPSLNSDTKLIDPEGRSVPIRTVIQPGNQTAHVAPLDLQGIYSTTETGASQPAIAANFQRLESDLAPIDPASLPELLGTENVHVALDIDSLQKIIEEHRVGRTYSEHLLLLALILAAVEFVYANMLARRTPDLSSRLRMTSSGKLGATKEGREQA